MTDQTNQFQYFLTQQEDNHLQDIGFEAPGWLEEFIAWAAKRTDASTYALKMGGLIALGTTAGDLVTLPAFFGDGIYLNLYILIMGPSSTVRKTTVMARARQVYPTSLNNDEKYVASPDDVSPQALNKLLAKAGMVGTPVVFTQDELATLITQYKNPGNYQSALPKILLTGYDHSPLHVLRTNGTIDVPQGAFISLLGASTPENMARALNQDDFESGLLPRFLVADLSDAQTGQRITIHERLETKEEWEAEGQALQEELSNMMLDRRTAAMQKPNAPPQILDLTPAAIDRLDDIDAVIAKIKGTGDTHYEAVLARSQVHIMKLSGLFAISRERTLDAKIDLQDVLRAMSTVETSIGDTLGLLEKAGMSERSKVYDYIEQRIKAQGGKGTKSVGYTQSLLNTPRRNAIDDLFQGGLAEALAKMTANGRINMQSDKPGWIHPDFGGIAK